MYCLLVELAYEERCNLSQKDRITSGGAAGEDKCKHPHHQSPTACHTNNISQSQSASMA